MGKCGIYILLIRCFNAFSSFVSALFLFFSDWYLESRLFHPTPGSLITGGKLSRMGISDQEINTL